MDKMTLGPALSTLQGQYTTEYPMQMAGAVLAVIPLVVMFFLFQKQFIEGGGTNPVLKDKNTKKNGAVALIKIENMTNATAPYSLHLIKYSFIFLYSKSGILCHLSLK